MPALSFGAVPSSSPGGSRPQRFSAEQQAALAQLRNMDRHVRAHEQAHLAAAGQYATGGPSYDYAVGPDGKLYAVGGEVSLDVSPDPSNPEKTIQKAQTIEAAANAPADPSSQDRMVAARAAQMERVAQQQVDEETRTSLYPQQAEVRSGQLISQLF